MYFFLSLCLSCLVCLSVSCWRVVFVGSLLFVCQLGCAFVVEFCTLEKSDVVLQDYQKVEQENSCFCKFLISPRASRIAIQMCVRKIMLISGEQFLYTMVVFVMHDTSCRSFQLLNSNG